MHVCKVCRSLTYFIIKQDHSFKILIINFIFYYSITEQVGKYFKAHVKPQWLPKVTDDAKIKVISAVIKENTTISSESPEHRFHVIAFAIGTKWQHCCSEGGIADLCDGHADSLCFYGAQSYFQTQLKKIILKEPQSLFYSTKNGYTVKPYYNFLLLSSQPACGFMCNIEKHILSWKMPFEKTLHLLECSSRILINSYIGIQGPLTILFARPVYIKEIIILKYDESQTENFSVFKEKKAVEDKMQKFGKDLPVTSRFKFSMPKITIYNIPLHDLKENFEETLCSFPFDEIDALGGWSVNIRDEIGNEGTYNDKEREKLEKLWKDIEEKVIQENDSEQFQQYQQCLDEISGALQVLSSKLDINTSFEKAKRELENKITLNTEEMKSDFVTLSNKFESVCIQERQYENAKELDKLSKTCNKMSALMKEKSSCITMLKILDDLLKKNNTQLLEIDCRWKKYCSLMKSAIDSTKSK